MPSEYKSPLIRPGSSPGVRINNPREDSRPFLSRILIERGDSTETASNSLVIDLLLTLIIGLDSMPSMLLRKGITL
jgi:hypothetical protein